jgi:hypothetical protein
VREAIVSEIQPPLDWVEFDRDQPDADATVALPPRLKASRFRCNSFGESASAQLGIRRRFSGSLIGFNSRLCGQHPPPHRRARGHARVRAVGQHHLCPHKGWSVKDSRPGADWFCVTRKAAVDLDLPRKDREGRKIRFLDNGL